MLEVGHSYEGPVEGMGYVIREIKVERPPFHLRQHLPDELSHYQIKAESIYVCVNDNTQVASKFPDSGDMQNIRRREVCDTFNSSVTFLGQVGNWLRKADSLVSFNGYTSSNMFKGDGLTFYYNNSNGLASFGPACRTTGNVNLVDVGMLPFSNWMGGLRMGSLNLALIPYIQRGAIPSITNSLTLLDDFKYVLGAANYRLMLNDIIPQSVNNFGDNSNRVQSNRIKEGTRPISLTVCDTVTSAQNIILNGLSYNVARYQIGNDTIWEVKYGGNISTNRDTMLLLKSHFNE